MASDSSPGGDHVSRIITPTGKHVDLIFRRGDWWDIWVDGRMIRSNVGTETVLEKICELTDPDQTTVEAGGGPK